MPAAIANYITSYMCKGELNSHGTFTILASHEEARAPFVSADGDDNAESCPAVTSDTYPPMVARFVNALRGSVDTPGQLMGRFYGAGSGAWLGG